MTDNTRREFLHSASAAMAAGSYSRILGANDRIRLGLVGAGTRGLFLMNGFLKHKDVQVASVCDIWDVRAERAAARAQGAAIFGDHRKLLENKALDAVLIATPDHWHAAVAIDALQAGKDVYVEKPLTLRIEEGPRVVKAARENGRICQVGMQQRSGPHYMRARDEYVRAGKLGKITMARTWWHGNPAHIRQAPEELRTKPAGLNWARYVEPVKWRDWDPQQYWNFRAYLDFGGGQITDLFTHWIDLVHMLMGQDIPIAASAEGGVYCYKDGRTAPDTIQVLLQYPGEWNASFEGTLVPGITGEAVELCGTKGRLFLTRQKFEFYPVEKNAKPVVANAERDINLDHQENFLKCLRSRTLPNGDVLAGHRSAQASHLGTIAYIQKRRIKFDPVREEILPM